MSLSSLLMSLSSLLMSLTSSPAVHGPLDSGLGMPHLNLPASPHDFEGSASEATHLREEPSQRKSKWTTREDDRVTRLRNLGVIWDDISKQLPGRTAVSCRLRFQNYLENRDIWDDAKKNKLARLYVRYVHQKSSRASRKVFQHARATLSRCSMCWSGQLPANRDQA